MIVFDLVCICGVQFEGWFEDRLDYERQENDGFITCPVCNCNHVHKILSPVAMKKNATSTMEVSHVDEHAPALSPVDQEKLLKLMKGVKKYVCDNFDDVGNNLAKEALKIHYGVNKPRNIRGVATSSEEEMLSKEGVELVKIPLLTDDDSSSN